MTQPASTFLSPRRVVHEYAANAEQSDLAEFLQEFVAGCPPTVAAVLFAMLNRQAGVQNPSVDRLFDGYTEDVGPLLQIDPDFAQMSGGIKTVGLYPRGTMAQQMCLNEVLDDAKYLLAESGVRPVCPEAVSLCAGVLELQVGDAGSAARLHALDDLIEVARSMKPPTKPL